MGRYFRDMEFRGPKSLMCPCGSGKPSKWLYDARGIHLCRACPTCKKQKQASYRQEVLTDPNYDACEAIEAD